MKRLNSGKMILSQEQRKLIRKTVELWKRSGGLEGMSLSAYARRLGIADDTLRKLVML